jgi:uncharacterized repeat protein (TIGR01451 family)
MRLLMSLVAGLTTALTLADVGVAQADVALGSVIQPSGSTPQTCSSTPTPVISQATGDPALTFIVPAGGGVITQWQTDVTFSSPGSAVSLVVLKPGASDHVTVEAVDTQHVPASAPPGNIATFTPLSPIPAVEGEELGLYTAGECFWHGGSTPSADTLNAYAPPTTPVAGDDLSPATAPSPGGFVLDLAATLVTTQDAAVTTSASPPVATVGNLALLSSSIRNAGTVPGSIKFTDTVPTGLTIDSAVAGSGTCAVAGQAVSCQIVDLPAGQSAPVNIVVTPSAAHTYTNNVSVSPLTIPNDPNTSNNAASASLVVTSAIERPRCAVPSLSRTPPSVAKHVLGLLHCKVGRTRTAFSNSVPNGLVIRTTPGRGTYSAGRTISLQVSKGRKPRHKHKRHR